MATIVTAVDGSTGRITGNTTGPSTIDGTITSGTITGGTIEGAGAMAITVARRAHGIIVVTGTTPVGVITTASDTTAGRRRF